MNSLYRLVPLSIKLALNMKLVKYVNERGGHAHISELKAPKTEFGSFQKMVQELYDHEIFVSQSINI